MNMRLFKVCFKLFTWTEPTCFRLQYNSVVACERRRISGGRFSGETNDHRKYVYVRRLIRLIVTCKLFFEWDDEWFNFKLYCMYSGDMIRAVS